MFYCISNHSRQQLISTRNFNKT